VATDPELDIMRCGQSKFEPKPDMTIIFRSKFCRAAGLLRALPMA
jgi:hypothetical protein